MDNKNFLNALVLAHCITQSEMYADALKESEGGYEPKTIIWEMLTVAETQGPTEVAEIVATAISGAKFKKLIDPVSVLTDLVMALKWKTKFFSPKKNPGNDAVVILNGVYNNALDVVTTSLYNGDIPSDVAEQVCDLVICE